MKIESNYADNACSIYPHEAAQRLRRRIRARRFRHVGNAAWLGWLAIRAAFKGTALFALEVIFFYMLLGKMDLVIKAFFIGNAFLLISAILEIRKKFGTFWLMAEKDSIVIGSSFRHLTSKSSFGRGYEVVGSDALHTINYLKQPNPHVLMLGSTSSGKTTTMRTFISRISARNKIPFLIIDWHGENEKWASEVNAAVWKVPEHFKVNLFKLNGMGREARASTAIESLAIAAHLTALQSTKVKSALLKFYLNGKEPTLLDLWAAICNKDAGKANVLNQRLRSVQRVIGSEPDGFWNGIFSGNCVVSLAGLSETEKSLVAYAILQRLVELFDKEQWNKAQPRLMVVVDEAWQLFRKAKDYDSVRESVAEKIVRLGRKYGIGIVISTQQMEDIPKVFLNSCSLIMIHQHRETSYFGRDLLRLNEYEQEYIKNADQGEMLLFDRERAQEGIWNSEYIKVDPLKPKEIQIFASTQKTNLPDKILEPEMPIEMQDGNSSTHEIAKASGIEIFARVDIPSVAVYRFMIALERTSNITEAYRMLKERGWLTSLATLYGGKSKPSILSRAISSGYVNNEGKFTEKGLNVINTERLIAKQGIYAGNEEHKELMRKTVKMIQNSGNFAFTMEDKNSFDVGELKAKMKRIWDFEDFTIYECQTNAIKEEIEKGIKKSEIHKTELVWIVNNKDTLEQIKKLTTNAYQYILI